MGLWIDLLGSWGGILSLGAIVFMILMPVFIAWFLKKHSD